MDTSTRTTGRVMPWNKGKLLGQKLPLKLKGSWAMRIRLQLDQRTRELALFNLAIDSKLRGCDLIALRVHDVVQGSHVANRAIVMQKKTQQPVQFEMDRANAGRGGRLDSDRSSQAGSVRISEPHYEVASSFDAPVFPNRRVLGGVDGT